MSKQSYLEIGLKLLGAYAALLGAHQLGRTLYSLFTLFGSMIQGGGLDILTRGLALPMAHFALAYVLTRHTPACARWCLTVAERTAYSEGK